MKFDIVTCMYLFIYLLLIQVCLILNPGYRWKTWQSNTIKNPFKPRFWIDWSLSTAVLELGCQTTGQCFNWLQTCVRYKALHFWIFCTKSQFRFNIPSLWLSLEHNILECSVQDNLGTLRVYILQLQNLRYIKKE